MAHSLIGFIKSHWNAWFDRGGEESHNGYLDTNIRIEIPGLSEDCVPLELVLVSAGSFLMGGNEADKDSQPNEKPQHRVTITEPIYLGKYPVTQAQWKAVMGGNPSHFANRPNHPVEQVNWHECQSFIRKLNQLELGRFRLPTEAEWEYACRAGTKTANFWETGGGPRGVDDFAWVSENAAGQTQEVGLKQPNPWGLHDIQGNVWEWCYDWYSRYPGEPRINPAGPPTGSVKVLRGGSFRIPGGEIRSAARSYFSPGNRYNDLGFRIAMM